MGRHKNPFTEEHRHKISEALKGRQNWLGKKHSPETILKMKLAKLGKKHTEAARAKMSASQKNRPPVTAETREKLSKAAKGRLCSDRQRKFLSDIRKGKGNPAWKGGVTPEHTAIRNSHEIREWRRGVYARDGYACVRCGRKGDICAHHINNFADHPDMRTEVKNGATLCEKCHSDFHVKYGWTKNTPAQFAEFKATRLFGVLSL